MPRSNHQPDDAAHDQIRQHLAHALVDGWLRYGRENPAAYQDALVAIAEKVFDDDEQFIAENATPPSSSAAVQLPDNLPPLAELARIAQDIYYIYANNLKRQDGLNMFGKLQRGLGDWADWQAQQAAAGSESETQTNANRVPQGAQQGN